MISEENADCVRILLFIKTSRILLPTQPSFQWVPKALFPGIKRPEREANHKYPDLNYLNIVFHSSYTL
jgi:hypothetical protein